MKKLVLILFILLISSVCQAQCVGEIKDVKQDEFRGQIIVETEYTLNGVVVQTGRSRYLETSGANAEIIAKAKEDIQTHCKNLIARIENNRAYLNNEKLKRQKALTTPIITDIKSKLVGHKETETEFVEPFKGKSIKVTYDENNTVTDIP